MSVTREEVIQALTSVNGPDGEPLVASVRLSAVVVRDGGVALSIAIEPREAAAWEPVRQVAERAISALAGVTRATVALTAEATTPSPSLGAAPAKRDGLKSGVAAARPASFPNLAKVRQLTKPPHSASPCSRAASSISGFAPPRASMIAAADPAGPAPMISGFSGRIAGTENAAPLEHR